MHTYHTVKYQYLIKFLFL